jgi:hypothetical protein
MLENEYNFDWNEDGLIGPQIIQPSVMINLLLFGKTVSPGYFA